MRAGWLVILGIAAMVVIPFAVDEPVAAIRGCAVAGVVTAVVGVSLRNSPHRGTRYVALVGTGLGVVVALLAWLFMYLASGFRPTP